jgi:CheY-like chemotaxis protein
MSQDNHMYRPQILVVEDSGLVARAIEMMLVDLGYRVVGPAPTSSAALDLLTEQTPRAALLDLYLEESTSHAVATALMERQIPFALLTGSLGPAPDPLGDAPVLTKPIDRQLLAETLAGLCAQHVK